MHIPWRLGKDWALRVARTCAPLTGESRCTSESSVEMEQIGPVRSFLVNSKRCREPERAIGKLGRGCKTSKPHGNSEARLDFDHQNQSLTCDGVPLLCSTHRTLSPAAAAARSTPRPAWCPCLPAATRTAPRPPRGWPARTPAARPRPAASPPWAQGCHSLLLLWFLSL